MVAVISEISESTLALLKEALPTTDMSDIESLINDLLFLDNQKIDQRKTLEKWLPSKEIVKEVIAKGLPIIELEPCINDFREFAKGKGWTIKDNLNPKFIVHVNIMVGRGQVRLIQS